MFIHKIPRSKCSIRLDVHAFKKQHTTYPKKYCTGKIFLSILEYLNSPNSKVGFVVLA